MTNRIAFVGGGWGLASAVFLGGLRAANHHGAPWTPELVLGNLAFTAVYAAPFLLAVWARRWESQAGRASAWAAGALLAAAGSITAFSGVSLVVLPSALVLSIAAAVQARQAHVGLLSMVAAIPIVAIVALAFGALFLSEDERCWSIANGRACTSDVVAPHEALLAVAILAAGAAVVARVTTRSRAGTGAT